MSKNLDALGYRVDLEDLGYDYEDKAENKAREEFEKSKKEAEETLKGLLDAASSVIKGIPGMVGGGLMGASRLVTSGGNIDEASIMQRYAQEKINQALGVEPKTEAGEKMLEALTKGYETLVNTGGDIGELVGGAVGAPNPGRAIGSFGTELALNFLPMKGGVSAAEAAKKPSSAIDALVKKEPIKEQVKEPVTEPTKEQPPQLTEEQKPIIEEELPPLDKSIKNLEEMGYFEAMQELIKPDLATQVREEALASKPIITDESPVGLEKLGDPDRPYMSERMELPKEVSAAYDAVLRDVDSYNLYKNVPLKERSKLLRKQSGALDPEVFEEGYVLLARALSKLTDQEWLKKKFPDTEFMTNSDGTPLVMLHGTTKDFQELEPKDLGLHLGFVVPSHRIFRYDEKYFNDYANIRPVVIKKGNYIFSNKDVGGYNHVRTINQIGEALGLNSDDRAKEVDLFIKYAQDKIVFQDQHIGLRVSTKDFNDYIKNRFNIDGIFYKNYFEVLSYGPNTTSFVTWNKDNVVSIFDDKYPVSTPKLNFGKQGGYILVPKEATDFVQKAFKKLKSFQLFEPNPEYRALERLPVSQALKESLIPEDIPVETVIKEALETPDVSPRRILIGGGAMLSELKGHPVIKATYQWFDNATKRARYLHNIYVTGAENAIRRLTNLEYKHVASALMDRFNQGVDLPADVLEVLSPDARTAFIEMDKAFKKALEVQNEARALLGKKPITPIDGYFASRWGGPWRAPIYANIDGKSQLVGWIAEQSKKQAEAAIEYLRKRSVSFEPEKSVIRFVDRPGTADRIGYIDLIEFLSKDDPRLEAVVSAYKDYLMESGIKYMNQQKHALPKSGKGGYLGDRPWDPKDYKRMIDSQLKYIQNAFEWAEIQKATAKAKEVFANKEVTDKAPNAVEISKEYALHRLGFGENKVVNAFESLVAETFKVSRGTLSQMVHIPRKLFYIRQLGMDVAFSLVSLSSGLYVLPKLMQLGLLKQNSLKTLTSSTMYGGYLFLKHAFPETIKAIDEGISIPDHIKKAIKYAEDNSILETTTMAESGAALQHPLLKSGEALATINMTLPEKLARASAFIAYVEVLTKHGKEMSIKALEDADRYVKFALADYRIHERAPLFNKLGITGVGLSTLQTFVINQYNQIAYYYKLGHKTGNYGPLLSLITLQFLLGGTVGFYGLDTIDKIWESLKGIIPDNLYPKVKDIKIRETLTKIALDHPEHQWWTHGAVSALTGIDMSSRYSMGRIVEPTVQGLFPFIDDAQKITRRLLDLIESPTSDVAQAQMINIMLPKGLRGQYQMMSKVFYDKANKLAMSMRDPTQAVYKRNEFDELVRKIGFYSMPESLIRDLDYRYTASEKQLLERRNNTVRQIKEAIALGTPEQLASLVERYYVLGGTELDLKKKITETQLERMMTKLQRLQIKAKTPSGVGKLRRYQE